MFGNFTEDARKILVDAKKEMYELNHPYVGSEHLMLSILKTDNSVSQKLKEYNLNYDTLREEIINVIGVGSKPSECFLYTPLLRRILENAIIDSKENNNGDVTIEHLFASLLEEGEGVAIRIMMGMNIDIDSLYDEFSYRFVNTKKKKNKKLLLEEMGIDLTKKALDGNLDPVVGRDNELKRVMEILCRRTKNNPILIGEAGVGKTAIAEELSRLIINGEVPLALRNKRVINLDMATMVAGTKYRGEFEDRMRKILKEVEENDDIILFIDEIHTLVGAGGAEGAIDASNIFKPALARNKLRCIGATTLDEYKKFIEKDSALERRFQKVYVDKPDRKTVKDILMRLKNVYEKFHLVSLSEEIIDLIIDLSEKYVYDRNEPDKSIDILDEVCARVNLKESHELKEYNELNKKLKSILFNKNESIATNDFKQASLYKDQENELMNKINILEMSLYKKDNIKVVTKGDVADIIHAKTKIPVYELLKDNKTIIHNIEKTINNSILGQDEAVKNTINIIKRLKLGFRDENKCYSCLFCGPSGVGKTKLAKLFGENIANKDNIIKLDMSEYAEAHSVSKIVGAPPGYVGYETGECILDEIKDKPYSVLILDEIERASTSVINLFLQILDEGKVKDSHGKIVRFDNVFIVMTSNIGFDENMVGFNQKNNDTVISKLKENFSVPFINRIDNIIVFNKLNENIIRKLIKEKINNLVDKYYKKGIKITINNNVIDEILKLTNYEEFGARKIDKIINDKLETSIIDMIIDSKKDINIKTINDKKVSV